jgi:hypothetical protein
MHVSFLIYVFNFKLGILKMVVSIKFVRAHDTAAYCNYGVREFEED